MDDKSYLETSIGSVKSIYISKAAGDSMQSVETILAIENQGLEGDRYATKIGFWQTVTKPRPSVRDVSLINYSDIEVTEFLESETRRSIIVHSEVQMVSLIGKVFRIGEAVFKGVEDCTPCKRPSELSGKPNFALVFNNKGGLRAQVLKTGQINKSDQIYILIEKV